MSIFRLIGFGIMAIAVVLLAEDIFLMLARHQTGITLKMGLEATLFLLGIAVVWKSSAFARRLTQDFEDE